MRNRKGSSELPIVVIVVLICAAFFYVSSGLDETTKEATQAKSTARPATRPATRPVATQPTTKWVASQQDILRDLPVGVTSIGRYKYFAKDGREYDVTVYPKSGGGCTIVVIPTVQPTTARQSVERE